MLLQSIPGIRNVYPSNGGAARAIGLRAILQVSLPLLILLYCAGFHFSYIFWISPVWAYEGLTYEAPSLGLLVVAYGLAAGLSVISPPKILRPSHAIYWILFFCVYVPGLFVPLFLQLDGDLALLFLQLSMTGGMLILALFSRISSLSFRRIPIKPDLFWAGFAVVYLLGNAALFVVYHNNLSFASMETMYSVRHASGKVLMENPATGYISQLLANVLNPLLIVYGWASRRKKLVVIGTIGQLFLYSIFANKLALLSPFIATVLYFSIKKDLGGWVSKMALFLAAFFFGLTILVIGAKPGIIFNLATVSLVRNFAIPGMLVGEYQYFFENQPHTYLGTVTGISLLVPNAYTMPVGVEVSAFYGAKDKEDKGRANGNANFFATDGIAAFGLWGIPLAGLICAITASFIDGCAKSYPLEFSIAAMAMIISSFANASLFTTLLGNGLIFWMLLFIFMPSSFSESFFYRSNGYKIQSRP